jgi:integrase
MASIRRRTWQTAAGEQRSAWQVDYRDQHGKRRHKAFATKREADAWLVQARGEVSRGVHTPESVSIKIAEAAQLWVGRCERDQLERSTLQQYKSHVTYAIGPLLGHEKLSRLTAPRVQAFVDQLLKDGRSRALTKKIVASLSSIVSEAQRRGLTAQNPVREVRVRLPKRDQGRPEMPTRAELRAILNAAAGRWRPLIVTAIFTGLRSSELRGARWPDVDLDRRLLHVRQRVDQWGSSGAPKSEASTRDIPLAPIVVNTLREWRLACPKGERDLVFPNTAGNVESHANLLQRGFHKLQRDLGIVDEQDRPKYGLHALRHAAAALFIEQGFGPKKLQALLGHSSIQMVFDQYGYLFEQHERDGEAVSQIEARLLA